MRVEDSSRARRRGRLLVLTPRFPYPLLGGDAIRIYQLCSALARDWDLTLLSICQSQQELVQGLPDDAPFKNVRRIFLPKWKSYLQAGFAVITGESLQVAYYRSGEFKRVVREISGDHDAVLCHLLRTAPYAIDFSGPRILELTDHLPLTYKRALALKGSGRGVLGISYRMEAKRVSHAQQRYASEFDLISFVSEIDREMFLRETGIQDSSAISFPVSVDMSQRPFTSPRAGSKLAFIGNMRTLQNRDAVRYFVTQILPRVSQSIPDVSLRVVGAVDHEFMAEFSGVGVEFAGVVPSVAEALSECCVGVCPVRIAAGMQNKVLDYMSLGLPAVTTKYGAEGLAVESGRHLQIADEPGEFADAVIQLLGNAGVRVRMAQEARDLVEAEYALDVNTERLKVCFAALCPAARPVDRGGNLLS